MPMAGCRTGRMVWTTVVVTSAVKAVTSVVSDVTTLVTGLTTLVTGVTTFVTDLIVCFAEATVSVNAGTSGTWGN